MPSSPVVSLLSASSSNRHLVLSSWIGQRATFGTRSKLRCLRPLRYTTRPHSFVTAWFVESARLECVIFSLDRSKLTSTFWTGTSCDRARQTLREHSKIIPLVPVVGSPDARRQIGTRLSSVRPLQHASHVGDLPPATTTLSACGLLSSRGSIASLALRPARRSCLRLTHVVASMSPRLDSRWGGSFPFPRREFRPLEASGFS